MENSNIYIYIFLNSGVKIHTHLLNVVVQFIVLLTLSTVICRGTDTSKFFIESLGIRDNESRLQFSKLRMLRSCVMCVIGAAPLLLHRGFIACHYLHR